MGDVKMDKKEIALKTFNSGFNCSQSVLSVFCEAYGLEKDIALKMATGFGGGLRKGEVCGAVTGAIMALGLKEGHFNESDTETKEKAYFMTKEFIRKFEERHETIICKKLLGYDVSDESQREKAKEEGLFDTVCPKFITDAIDILEDMIPS